MGDDVEGCDRADGSVDIGDLDSVQAAVDRVRPEVVYHLAGWSDVGGSWAAPIEVFRANAEGTLNVLIACERARVDRVLAVSSADVYGIVREDQLPLTEDSALRPVTPYAASKVAADYLALQAWLGPGLPVLRARPSTTSAPDSSHGSSLPRSRSGSRATSSTAAMSCRSATCRRVVTSPTARRRPRVSTAGRARRARRGVQRVLRPGGVGATARRGAADDGAPAHGAQARPRTSNGRSTCPCSWATTRVCTRPPAGSQRSPSSRPWPTCSTTCAPASGREASGAP